MSDEKKKQFVYKVFTTGTEEMQNDKARFFLDANKAYEAVKTSFESLISGSTHNMQVHITAHELEDTYVTAEELLTACEAAVSVAVESTKKTMEAVRQAQDTRQERLEQSGEGIPSTNMAPDMIVPQTAEGTDILDGIVHVESTIPTEVRAAFPTSPSEYGRDPEAKKEDEK